MQASVMAFTEKNFLREEVAGKKIVEVGASDASQSTKTLFSQYNPACYVCTDMRAGGGIDIVCMVEDLAKHFGEESFDIVISTEMIEHVEHWREAISSMKRTLKPSGILLLTTCTPGYNYHPSPEDYWRFTEEDFKVIFSDMETLTLVFDSQGFGVFIKARKPNDFQEIDLSSISILPVQH